MRRAIAFLIAASTCGAYSALSHEAIIDSVWKSHIQPLLLAKFPNATPDELKEAHAYVYGGCQIQDLGYFPFSSHAFSDFAHYVRSGDFVTAMLHDAQTLDEYAFAIGALAHYTADRTAHPTINEAVGMIYPKLRHKYGPRPTYEDNPADHLKVEFSFDVVQVSRGLYAPDDYHDFIGFKVSKEVLERAFHDTYGIELKEIFKNIDLGIGTYRFAMGKLIPEMTKVAWDSKRSDIEKLSPGVTRTKFVYALPQRQYNKEWDGKYKRPGPWTRFLAFIFRAIPTVGPFKVLSFKPVPDKAERAFLKSFELTVEAYKQELNAERQRSLKLANYNLDTGKPVKPGDYRLADNAYALLLDKASGHPISPELRKNILDFFTQANLSEFSKKTISQLERLKSDVASASPTSPPLEFPPEEDTFPTAAASTIRAHPNP